MGQNCNSVKSRGSGARLIGVQVLALLSAVWIGGHLSNTVSPALRQYLLHRVVRSKGEHINNK